MSISKKIKFKIFKRDGFTCVYCGKSPPQVTLEVDHIEPKSKGGSNDINNLITACFDCNRGKSNIILDKSPAKLKENLEILQEQEAQIKEYRKFMKKIQNRLLEDVKTIEEVVRQYHPEVSFTDYFINNMLKRYLRILRIDVIEEAIHIAFGKIDDPQRAIKYFCGICWNKIGELENNG